MALAEISWLLLSLIVAVTLVPCTCEDRARMAGSLLHCYAAPALTSATNVTAFRASLLPLLGALPSAAAPTGFASLLSDGAFVRGLCFGNATECLGCLSTAAMNITAGCGATSRRAGIWSAGCFLAYADTETSSPSEDAFRELIVLSVSGSGSGDDADADTEFYSANLHHMFVAIAQAVAQRAAAEISGARMLAKADATTATSVARGNSSYSVLNKVRVVARCARDGAAGDCIRCLQDSARAVDWDLEAARGRLVAAVVGFNCYLHFEVSISVESRIDSLELALIFLVLVIILRD